MGPTSSETLACLIIDDPLLRPRYGCLDYEKLLMKMKEHHFFTEIAFIPYNYKRSHQKIISMFAENPEYFAICVHGCNHTGNEFGQKNYHHIKALASAALWRMEEHKKITGLSYDPVFVFPQGYFSSIAMKALKDEGYFAAFNSTINAIDKEKLPSCEYQKPFTNEYYNFPLFLRRYPRDRFLFLQDIENNRPIIIVGHHDLFRNGYNEITDLVDWINKHGNIEWTSLLNIVEHYLNKKAPNIENSSMSIHKDMMTNPKIILRRLFSEIRDNYVETNTQLTKVYKIIRKFV